MEAPLFAGCTVVVARNQDDLKLVNGSVAKVVTLSASGILVERQGALRCLHLRSAWLEGPN